MLRPFRRGRNGAFYFGAAESTLDNRLWRTAKIGGTKMAILTKGPRGTQDVLPAQSYKWQYLEKKVMEIAGLYGFREIRVPTFEHKIGRAHV